MNTGRLQRVAFLLISGLLVLFNPAHADSHSFDFQTNAKMMHKHHGPVDNAYGLVNVNIDSEGHGRLEVLFSNGSRIDWVRFNAQVKFIDAAGSVIREDLVYRWLKSADAEGADERRVTRLITLNRVKSVEVEFFLTDIIESRHDEFAGRNTQVAYY